MPDILESKKKSRTHRKTAYWAEIRRNKVTSLDTTIGDILILDSSVTNVTRKFLSRQDFKVFKFIWTN